MRQREPLDLAREGLAREPQARAYGAERNAQELGDVLSAHLFELEEHEHQALLDRSSSAALRATGTASGRIAADLTDYALDRNMEWSGRTTAAIHDAVAVGHLAIHDLVDVAPYHVEVDATNGPARGRTVCDGLPYRLRRDGRAPNAEVGIRIDRGRFEAVLLEAFGSLP